MEHLDLERVLYGHLILCLVSAISVSPAYNLPVFLFGLASVNAQNAGVRQFAMILIATGILDILWLISGWKDQSSALSITLVIGNLLLKPITLLVTLSEIKSRGESLSLPTGASLNSFSGGRATNSNNYQGFSGGYQGDGEEEEAVGVKKSQVPVPMQSTGEGYHTLE